MSNYDNIINIEWELFLSNIAKKENQPILPNVIDDEDEIISEIKILNQKNDFLDFLSGIKIAVDNQTLLLNLKKHTRIILQI